MRAFYFIRIEGPWGVGDVFGGSSCLIQHISKPCWVSHYAHTHAS